MIKENTHYFDHDYNAQNDPKIEAMLFEKGWEGYGIFWAIVEKLAQEPCHKLLKLYDRIAFVLRTKFELVKSIVEDYRLFQFDDQYFWSERLNRHFKKREEKSLKAKESISKRWGKYTTVLPTNYEGNTIKGKEKKENEIKEEDNINTFVEKKNDEPKKDEPKKDEPKIPQKSKKTGYKALNEVEFRETLVEYEKDFPVSLILDFYAYWSEKDSRGRMKFQLRETWEVKRRLHFWARNNEGKYSNSQIVNKNGYYKSKSKLERVEDMFAELDKLQEKAENSNIRDVEIEKEKLPTEVGN